MLQHNISMGFKMNFCIVLLFIFLDFFHLSNSIDTITSTQFISGAKDQTLLSSNGNFKLGFFSPNNSLNRYVGIWFNKVSKQTLVWVANRDYPLKDKNGIFKISGDGNIGVFAGKNGGLPLWSSNVSMANTINSTAKLLDSGNFVLTRTNGPGRVEIVVWQSFDYPTDTVLAGMKLGLNRRTGLNRVLTSWKAEDDPASGEFSFGIEARGSAQLFLYKMLAPYWRAGPWNGRTLSGLPIVSSRIKTTEFELSDELGLFNYSYVNSNDEIYLTFTVPNESIFSTLTLDPLGTAGRQVWRADTKEWIQFWATPQDKCDEYARCGPWAICNAYNTMQCTCLPGFEQEFPREWYSKCVEKKRKVETCGKGNGEGFIRLTGLKVPDARTSRLYANLSLKECEMECLKSCNCSGYASANINVGGRGCFLWYGELVDVRVYVQAGQDFYLRADASELAANMRKKVKGLKKTIKITILSLLFGVFLFISCYCYLRRKQVKRKGLREKQKNREMLLLDSGSNLSHINSTNSNNREDSRNLELTFFDINTVIAATKKFSPAKKIGEGGYGPVYKGELPNGQEIAVKRLSKNSGQGSIEFKNEALLIARLQHRNLVRLVGCCIENEEKMLIYEYMPNKSLDYFIFDENRKSSLDWKRRHEIIVGVARGMLYLHQDSRLRIIHRDLKASNILLDEELNPKISDFGTARIFGGNQNEANTNRVVGTFGYMSPEYALDGLFSVKSDVFSFGVLLLEIISGKKNTGFFQDDPSSNLIRNAWQLWSEDRALEIVDTSMGDSCPTYEVLRCIQVGLLCVQDNATDRPTMSSAVFMLSNETTLPSPKQPMFAIQRSHNNPDSTTTATCSSINEVTVTMPDAR